ncbi:unnamed protein product [Cylicocyclus nassatus]|uniref:Uncharacterized protein n=1 Tax=Cylicocyclus nassatus TaxID=53992 RepID=A0AA36GJV3_CYLNA|nr:unnamed protein product [Cylicocyclus nassatus]
MKGALVYEKCRRSTEGDYPKCFLSKTKNTSDRLVKKENPLSKFVDKYGTCLANKREVAYSLLSKYTQNFANKQRKLGKEELIQLQYFLDNHRELEIVEESIFRMNGK